MFVPPGLDPPYLERVLSRRFATDLAILQCEATNLCVRNFGGVSCSGSTVLLPVAGLTRDVLAVDHSGSPGTHGHRHLVRR